jgi:2-haloacid dehalogenase
MAAQVKPRLITFDVFGTIVDWRTGLFADLKALGVDIAPMLFDRIIDVQGALEQNEQMLYRDNVAHSLVDVCDISPEEGDAIGKRVGTWPLFPDAREGLLRILDAGIPICAMTNSDREHGKQVQSQLGFAFTHWFCAEQTGIYKPSRGFWESVSESLAEPYGPQWWHVSAYGDYDLGVAHSLVLSTVNNVDSKRILQRPKRIDRSQVIEFVPQESTNSWNAPNKQAYH